MSTMPTVTIAIPSYNKASYIRRCIESAIANKDDGVDIILVDNASTDDTYAIAKSYEPNITSYRNSENIGMAANWNRSIEHATGDWILILHADDELLPDVVQHYRAFIKKYPSLGIIHAGSFATINGASPLKSPQRDIPEFWKAGVQALQCEYGVCSSVMVKKDAYTTLGGFITSSLSADVEMWARIASRYDTGYMNIPTVTYHVNEASTGLHSLTNRSVAEITKDWDLLNSRIAALYPTEESRNEFLAGIKKRAPYGYFAILRANIRARNLKNIRDALFVIIFEYKAPLLLVNLLASGLAKKAMRMVNKYRPKQNKQSM